MIYPLRFCTKILLAATIFLVISANSYAITTIGIKDVDSAKTKIAFVGFTSTEDSVKSDAIFIADKIRRNLDSTGLFNVVVESEETLEGAAPTITAESIPDFNKYSAQQVDMVLLAHLSRDNKDNLQIRVRLWDILDQRQLFAKLYAVSQANYSKSAAEIANEIFKSLTGEKIGHFNSKIVYVAETGDPYRRMKQLVTMDFDGDNRQVLTDGNDLVITPNFTKSGNRLFYVRYYENRPQIFVLDLSNGARKKIGEFGATNFAPSAHPFNQNVIVFSAIINGNTDIYKMDITTSKATRLTKDPAIDTTPSFSPDGQKIIFSSSRQGKEQLYLMNENGSDFRKISKQDGVYSKPIWSPDGKRIAFTKKLYGQFYAGTMLPDGNDEKLLIGAYLIESVRWSPNSRYLIYSKKRGAYGDDNIPKIYIYDTDTDFEFAIPTPADEGATDPDWRNN